MQSIPQSVKHSDDHFKTLNKNEQLIILITVRSSTPAYEPDLSPNPLSSKTVKMADKATNRDDGCGKAEMHGHDHEAGTNYII